jgi:hypothetical protein
MYQPLDCGILFNLFYYVLYHTQVLKYHVANIAVFFFMVYVEFFCLVHEIFSYQDVIKAFS